MPSSTPTSRTGPLFKAPPRRRAPLLVVVLLLGAVLLVVAYVSLPLLIEDLIAKELQNGLGLAQKPEVTLEGNPLGVLAGKFQGGHVTLTNPDLGGVVRPDKVTIDLNPIDINVLGSLRSGRIESDEPLSGDLEMDLSEEEVSRIAASTGVVKGVKLEEGRMIADFGAGDFGARAPGAVEGSLTLQDGVLRFEPERAQVLGVPVPRRQLREASFSYPIDEVSLLGGTLSKVEVHRDRLILSGKVDNLPVG